MPVADFDDAADGTDEAAPVGGFDAPVGWVVDDPFDVGVSEPGDDEAGGDDGAVGELAQPPEWFDADRDRQQRAGAESVGGGGGRAHRHLDEGVAAALLEGADRAVAFILEAELFAEVGVGAIVAMTFRAAVDQPDRFRSSKKVGACFGLTPRKYQSGETDRDGAISRAGDASVRVALFEAAHVIMTRVAKWSKLKAWAMNVAKRRGAKRAKVALARKLGVVLHRMWLDETDFRFGQQAQA